MRGKWLLICVLAIGLGVLGGALSVRVRRQHAAPPSPSGAATVTNPEVTISGTIRPQHVVKVGAQVAGNIETFMVDVGEEVFEGQVLARIGAGGLESERESAAHAVESAQDKVSKAEQAILSARMEASRAGADAQRARNNL